MKPKDLKLGTSGSKEHRKTLVRGFIKALADGGSSVAIGELWSESQLRAAA